MWTKWISFIEHLVSIEVKKKSFEKLHEWEFFGAFLFPSVNKKTIDFSFTSINLLQPENHTINEVCSYSGCLKSFQENNKMHDKLVTLGSLTGGFRNHFYIGFVRPTLA